MIIWMDRPFANDHQKGTTSCKLSSGRTGLLRMMIRIDLPLANDHLARPAACKWSSKTSRLLQMIIWMDRPLANDHPDRPASCKWSSFSLSFAKTFYFSKYFPLFALLLIYSPEKKTIFCLQINSSFFFLSLFSSEENTSTFSKYNLPFPSRFYYSPAKKNSFSRYHPFPSVFIFSSLDPKLKILESWGSILWPDFMELRSSGVGRNSEQWQCCNLPS